MGTWGSEWNLFGSFGLWIFDPFYGGYCFLPFGHRWSSPYGYGYNSCIHHYNLPPMIYNPPVSNPTAGGPPVMPAGNPTVRGPVNKPVATATDRSLEPVPPFVRMQQSMGSGGRGITDHGGGSHDSGSNNSSPSYSPPSYSAPTRDSAPTTKVDSAPMTKQP